MTLHMVTLDDIKNRSIEDILQSVLTDQQMLTITFPDGAEVLIQPKPQLRRLPVLEGYIPPGWKDAIYEYAQ